MKLRKYFFIILIALIAFPQFAETIYSPSLPIIAHDLKVYPSMVEWTLSIYFFGFAIGVVFWGRYSDLYGRKIALLKGLIICLVGSILCYSSYNISFLFLGRFVQSFGMSACSIVSQTIIRDIAQEQERRNLFIITGLTISFAPSVGPFIGSILSYYHWKFCFLFLIIFAIILLLTVSFFLSPSFKKGTTSYTISNCFVNLIKDKIVIYSTIIIGLFYGILFSYYAESPFIFINLLNFSSKEYGIIGIFISSAAIIASLLSKVLNKHFIAIDIIKFGVYTLLCSSSILLLSIYFITYSKFITIFIITISMMLFFISFALTIPYILSFALDNHKCYLGTAGSIIGMFYYLIVSVIVYYMGKLHNGSCNPMAIYFLILSLTIFGCFYYLKKSLNELKHN
jgi:Bcr/CflA subfamily drug resistance transporter